MPVKCTHGGNPAPDDSKLADAGIDVLGTVVTAILEEGAELAATPPTSHDVGEWIRKMRSVSEDALIVSAALVVLWRRFGEGEDGR